MAATDQEKRDAVKALVATMNAADAAKAHALTLVEPGNLFHRKNADGTVTLLTRIGNDFQSPTSIDLDIA